MKKRSIPLAWLQLIRQKGRFFVALSGIAFADILMLMQLGFESALYDSNTRLHQNLNADVVLISPQARNLANMATFSRRRLFQAASLPEVESATPLYVAFADWKNPQTRSQNAILLLGFDLEKPAFNLPEINQNLGTLQQADTLLFDRSSRGDYKQAIARIGQGETVSTEIKGRTIHLKGLFTVGSSFAADGSLMTSDQNFLRIVSQRQAGEVSVGLITLAPNANPNAVVTALKSRLPHDVRVLTRAEFIEFEEGYWRRNTAIGFIFALGTLMGFMVGVIIVYQILYSDVSDHMAEYATLKAMGYRNLYLLGVVLQEALLLAVLGYIPGNLIAIGLYSLTRNATNLPIYMTLSRTIYVLLLTIIMCVMSGAVAVRKLRLADPADIF
ncbi:FtsX-like permease family protein [Cyanobacteria bacterium FACHB-502]|nr:FtsX-like permease family protein [Cyanobacteria bacterium FACHB-502]